MYYPFQNHETLQYRPRAEPYFYYLFHCPGLHEYKQGYQIAIPGSFPYWYIDLRPNILIFL